MKWPFFSKKTATKTAHADELSDFLLHASSQEKMRIFTEAAQRANQDQRAIIEQSKKISAARH